MKLDLTNTLRKITGSIRPMLVAASLVAALGIAAIGRGRTIEARTVSPDSVAHGTFHSHQYVPVPTSRVMTMEVTAYCACTRCCGPNAQGITASGKDISYNAGKFVAADRSLPFGTRLFIPGYDAQPVEVIDRGGAIKGNRLDVFFASHEEALEWGRRTVTVTVFE